LNQITKDLLLENKDDNLSWKRFIEDTENLDEEKKKKRVREDDKKDETKSIALSLSSYLAV